MNLDHTMDHTLAFSDHYRVPPKVRTTVSKNCITALVLCVITMNKNSNWRSFSVWPHALLIMVTVPPLLPKGVVHFSAQGANP